MRAVWAAVLILAGATPAVAQSSAKACPKATGWDKPERHAAARAPRFQFGLKPNTSAQLQLHVQRSVQLASKQGRQGWMKGYAGLAVLDVAKAGKLEVLLSSRAYVDLVENGKTLKSVAHGRANCGGVYKTVSFDVQPGRHIVQITDSAARSIRLGTIQR